MNTLRSTVAAFGLLALCQSAQAAADRLVIPQFLLDYAGQSSQKLNVIDFRPAIDAQSSRIVFERQLPDKSSKTGYSKTIVLYVAGLVDKIAQPLFRTTQSPDGIPSTRPDWCAAPGSNYGKIAYFVPKDLGAPPGVFTIVPDGKSPPIKVSDNAFWSYPTWLPDCGSLAVDHVINLPYGPYKPKNSQYSNPGPSTLHIDLSGNVLEATPLSGTSIWAGFPSFNPKKPNLLALAAQQLIADGYNENLNYVYIADTRGTPPRVHPLDHGAPVNFYAPRYEGRAPTWSPDGKWIAFESNRNCANKSFYAIFVEASDGRPAARQVTDCGYNAQHAKWYPAPVKRHTLLITTVRLNPTYTGTDVLQFNARGIASLDVTKFVNP